MSLANIERATFFFASASPLSCLILDQRLWPDCAVADVENCEHREHMEFPRGVKNRKPLENAAMAENIMYRNCELREGWNFFRRRHQCSSDDPSRPLIG